MKFYIADTLNQWKIMATLPSTVFLPKSCQDDINTSIELTAEINTDIGKWWSLLTTSDQYGILMVDSSNTIPFVKSKNGVEQGFNGVLKTTFYGASWRLDTSKRVKTDLVYNGSLQALIGGIDPQFDWMFISPDQTINYEAKVGSNFDLLKDLCTKYGLAFLDGNLNTWGQPRIIVGTPEDIAAQFPVYTVTNQQFSTFSDTEILVNKLTKKYPTNYVTHLYVYIDSAGGGAQNTRQVLTDPNASYISPGFYLEYEQIRGKYYIVNKDLLARVKIPRYDDFSVSSSSFTNSNITSSQVQGNLTPEQVRQNLYNYGVKELQKRSATSNYTFDFSYRRFLRAGTKILVNYRENITNTDGTKQTTIDTTTDLPYQYLRSVKYDEKDFTTFA